MKDFWTGFHKKAHIEKEAIFGAAIAHLLQNAAIRRASSSKTLSRHVANSFQQGFFGQAPGKIRQFLRGSVAGVVAPEGQILFNHAHELGRTAAEELRSKGIARLSPRDQVLARNLLRGDFEKIHRRGEKYLSHPVHKAILHTFAKSHGLDPKTFINSPEGARALEKVWKSSKNPLTSNITSGLLQRTGKATGRATDLIVPAKTKPLSYGLQQAGATLGAGGMAAVDPATAAMNYGKSSLSNHSVRSFISKSKFGDKALRATDKFLVTDSINDAYQKGKLKAPLSGIRRAASTYGLNAITGQTEDLANQLAHASTAGAPQVRGVAPFKKLAAGNTAIDDWFNAARDEEAKLKKDKEGRRDKIDPRELSEWPGPDAWHRGN